MVELDLAKVVEGVYQGDIVSSDSKHIEDCSIQIKRLNKVLVKIDFSVLETPYSFRGMLSDQKEGTLMITQEKISDEFILSGVSGFLYKKPNVHGGFINQLNSFYFHIILDHFNGNHQEVYFLGQRPGESKSTPLLNRDQIFNESLFSTAK